LKKDAQLMMEAKGMNARRIFLLEQMSAVVTRQGRFG